MQYEEDARKREERGKAAMQSEKLRELREKMIAELDKAEKRHELSRYLRGDTEVLMFLYLQPRCFLISGPTRRKVSLDNAKAPLFKYKVIVSGTIFSLVVQLAHVTCILELAHISL